MGNKVFGEQRLLLVIPIGKRLWRKLTLEMNGISRENVRSRVEYWFSYLEQIVINQRQTYIRAYNNLPDYFTLFYQEAYWNAFGKQKWKTIYEIRAFRTGLIKIYEMPSRKEMLL